MKNMKALADFSVKIKPPKIVWSSGICMIFIQRMRFSFSKLNAFYRD